MDAAVRPRLDGDVVIAGAVTTVVVFLVAWLAVSIPVSLLAGRWLRRRQS